MDVLNNRRADFNDTFCQEEWIGERMFGEFAPIVDRGD